MAVFDSIAEISLTDQYLLSDCLWMPRLFEIIFFRWDIIALLAFELPVYLRETQVLKIGDEKNIARKSQESMFSKNVFHSREVVYIAQMKVRFFCQLRVLKNESKDSKV